MTSMPYRISASVIEVAVSPCGRVKPAGTVTGEPAGSRFAVMSR
jgi:hypothetical protein